MVKLLLTLSGIANSGLMRILLNMNTSLVTALQGSIATGKVLFDISQYHSWNSIGATATRETVTTLGQLLQRVLQAAPIQPSLSSGFSEGGIVSKTHSNGDKYKGQLNQMGLRHGFGKYSAEKWVFIGEWVEGKKEGYGKETYTPVKDLGPRMVEYEGTFQKGKRHGYGKSIYSNRGEHVGEWDSGHKRGYGKLSFLEGDYYEGQFNHGLWHGYGVYSYSRSEKYEGEWILGKKQGYGTMTWTDGVSYEGEFDNDLPHGPGVIIYPHGERYEGYVVNGKRDGYGKQIKRSGAVVEAMWKNGEIERVLI
jgi:hypothetical protein